MAIADMSPEMIEEVTQFFKALGDVSRLRILGAILDGAEPLSQGAVSERVGLSQANASKHLIHLKRMGLVDATRDGNTIHYSIATPLVARLCDLVCAHVGERVAIAFRSIRK